MDEYEAYWIEWCKTRTRFYTAWGEALRIIGPILVRRQDEALLKLFEEENRCA
ncbi:hypothetical protein LCGC14_1887120 [marine sediment metagenome]|uniref:Uncharacterized protein n=1 Tax=marine sediment metagenome TaxID=412755 RepID=A0A0F9GNV9_9ZZZZ